jgi:hypothetical protein
MNGREKGEFPQWMFDDPWETLLSYLIDARQTAVQIKLAVHALKMEPALAKIPLEAIGTNQFQTAEQLADHIDKYTESLLDTISSLAEFRSAVAQHQSHDQGAMD